MNIAIYLIVIFICLFILFGVSRHDFVLLRQNINLRQVFDNVFVVILVAFISARLGFILYAQKFDLINPLKFFYLTKYWGIVPFVGFISILVTLLILFRKKKNILRIFDIYLISLSPLILLDVMLQNDKGINMYLKFISIAILSLFYFWFIKIHNKFHLKDGFITALIFITYSLVALSFTFSDVGFFNLKFVWFQAVLILTLVVSSLILLLVQRDFFNK